MVENGEILLDHLTSDNLFKHLDSIDRSNSYKTMTLERHNFKGSMAIPPKSDVEKYLAVLPINFNYPVLNISMKNYILEKQMEYVMSSISLGRQLRANNKIKNRVEIAFSFFNIWIGYLIKNMFE